MDPQSREDTRLILTQIQIQPKFDPTQIRVQPRPRSKPKPDPKPDPDPNSRTRHRSRSRSRSRCSVIPIHSHTPHPSQARPSDVAMRIADSLSPSPSPSRKGRTRFNQTILGRVRIQWSLYSPVLASPSLSAQMSVGCPLRYALRRGGTTTARVVRRGSLNNERVSKLIRQSCSVLNALHSTLRASRSTCGTCPRRTSSAGRAPVPDTGTDSVMLTQSKGPNVLVATKRVDAKSTHGDDPLVA
jgi:hypothetical protein